MTDQISTLPYFTFRHVELTDIKSLTEKAISEQNKFSILYLNHHIYNLCLKNKELRDAISSSTSVHLDGIGIWLGLKMLGSKDLTRFNWTDNAKNYLKHCAVKNYQ